jgi:hypothetical protein
MSEFPSRWSEPFAVPVERGKVREIARAARSANPDYVEHDAPPAPPALFYGAPYLFGTTWENPGDGPLRDAPVEPANLLHAEEEVEFPGPPPCAGAELTARTRLESVEDKRSRSSGGVLRFVKSATEYRDANGEVVAIARTTAVEERGE